MMDYNTNLNRFIEAQNSPGFAGYNNAVEEIRQGKKLSHWIWYVFPQLKAISQNSPYEKKYGIENLKEAEAYLKNPTLRKRLDDVCEILLRHKGKTANGIFGVSDSLKVRSSMTLFYLASRNELYKQVLDKYYNGRPCQNTLYALNMKMPEPTGSLQTDEQKQETPQNRKPQTNARRPQQFVGASRLRALRKRKMKKLAFLIVGLVVIIALFGGVGYGAYLLFTGNKEEPVIAETENNIDLHVNVAVFTSDHENITIAEMEKCAITLAASMGNNPVQLDSSTNIISFYYNNENSSEEIKIGARVDTCQIGGQTYTMSDYAIKEGSCEDTFNLDVCREDLRIYEELAWYQSAKKKVSSGKYPKYVGRIKNVQNKDFADFLTQKLTSIGRETDEQNEKEVKDKELGALPLRIRHYIERGRMIPNHLLEDLNPSERRIISSYNRWIKFDGRHQDKVLHYFKLCTTYRGLETVLDHLIR